MARKAPRKDKEPNGSKPAGVATAVASVPATPRISAPSAPPSPPVVVAGGAHGQFSATTVLKRHDMWEQSLRQLDEVAKLMKIDPNIHVMLRHPKRTLEVSVPVRMDDGHVEVFQGYRVHHNQYRGPC